MKKIFAEINPYLEYINSLLLTSRYNEITSPFIGGKLMNEAKNEYTDAIRSFFKPYAEDPIYGYIESLIPNGFTFSRPVELMLSLGRNSDFKRNYPLSELCIEYCGGSAVIHELLQKLKAFSLKTRYFDFLETQKHFYEPILEEVRLCLEKYPFIDLLESEYGISNRSYHYVISSLMVGNFGINFTNPNTKENDLFSVFATDHFSLSNTVLFHEYSHPFINPLTEKYADSVEHYRSAYEKLKPYRLPNFQSGYGDWEECVNEHFVRAMAIHLLRKCSELEEAARQLENDWNHGYRYLPFILERYQYYDLHREEYRTFEEFYPELLHVFSENI